jgi:hypothetical protein
MVSVDGRWDDVLKRLYVIFEQDIKNGNPRLDGCMVWHDKRKKDGNRYEEGFWHLIERRNSQADERQFDPRRSERLPWCKPTIENSSDGEALMWEFEEDNGQVKTYIWLLNFDYVVILARRPTNKFGDVYNLITAYHVDGDSTRRKFNRKYESRVQK